MHRLVSSIPLSAPLAALCLLLGAVPVALGCASAPLDASTKAPPEASTKAPPIPRVAIVTAFEPELKAILSSVEVESTAQVNGRTFHLGKLRGKNVIVFNSGISTVNAAMTVQSALDRFAISRIVMSGIAGGVNPDLHIGDVTVPRQWANYQEQSFGREIAPGQFKVEPWETTELGNFGMMFPQYMRVVGRAGPDKEEPKLWFDTDPLMLSVATSIAAKVELDRCTADGSPPARCLTTRPTVKVGGRGVTGPTFVNNAEYRTWVWKNFRDPQGAGVDALDMESGSVALVAYVNNVPFIAFRALSDLAGAGEHAEEASTFFALAASNSAKVVTRFIEEL